MHYCNGCIHIVRSSHTLYYVFYIPQNTEIFLYLVKMYWLIVISRRQGGLCIISSPDCIFIAHVKKEKNHVCTLYWTLFKHSCTFFDLRSQRSIFIVGVFMIHLLLLELPPSISVIDWFQKSRTDCSESLVYLRSHWGKKAILSIHSSSFADALVCSSLALLHKDFFFLSVH